MYKTGDLARWIPDGDSDAGADAGSDGGGSIDFLGRIDHQVKLRGFRIELGEIESQLLEIDYIKQAVVIDKEENGERYLCAYIVSNREFEVSEIRDTITDRLPDYMIPSYFVALDKIPLTPNGKIDRKSLPKPKIEAGKKYIAPRNKDERRFVELWSEVLGIGIEKISIDANFFELGGHSLKATIMASKIYKEFNVKIPLIEIFKTPTIKELTHIIKNEEKERRIKKDINLVFIKKDKNRSNNLFFIHDGYGEVEMYVEFCMNLNAGFNYWGIRADKIENFSPREINVKDLAKNYIKKIKKIQPHGPYNIAGWSHGGIIAFEMIWQLEQLGEEIRFFSMVDSSVPALPGKVFKLSEHKFTVKSELKLINKYLKEKSIVEQLKQLKDVNQLWPMIVAYLEDQQSRGAAIEELTFIGNRMDIPYIKQNTIKETIYFINMMRTFDHAIGLYKPGGKVYTTLNYFKAAESNFGAEKWKKYFSNHIRFYEVTGNHFSIFKNPDFAERFDNILNKEH
jgi:thioesterase domain-containing protein/acyl carrier protein